MKIAYELVLLISVAVLTECSGYRILGIYPFVGKSHFIMINELLKGLAHEGHQVDLISIFPEKEKVANLTQIITLSGESQENTCPAGVSLRKNFIRSLGKIGSIGYKVCENLGDPRVLKLIQNPPKDPPYDVIITQTLNYPCFAVIGHLWNVPVVLVSTASLYPWMHDMIGNPENIAFSPNNMVPIPEGNGFWTRFANTYLFYLLKFNYLYRITDQDQLLQKYFGPEVPSVRELERETALILMNTYFPMNGPKPMATNLIEIGGLHIQNNGPELPADLKRWLDESKNGVVYFTLGSMVRLETYPKEIVQMIFRTLEKLAPTRVLIMIAKPEDLRVKIPSNFYILPWIPQEKVLQHPNVKLFITHAGLLSTQESVHYGVPMLCMPILADQNTNAANLVAQEVALSLDIETLNKKDFSNALKELLKNPTYRENIRRLSKMFQDRPQSAMQTAIFWIEFIIRNGKDSMKSPAMDLTWWQIELLDVYAVTLAGLALILCMIIFILKSCFRLVFAGKAKVISKEKKRK